MSYKYILWMIICHLRRGNGGHCKALFQIPSFLYFCMFPCFAGDANYFPLCCGQKGKHKKVSPGYPFW